MFGRKRPRLESLAVEQGLPPHDIADGGLSGAGRRGVAEAIAGPCDCCAAAAAVRARLASGSVLMLCGHHGRRHAAALLLQHAELTGELGFARTAQAVPA